MKYLIVVDVKLVQLVSLSL